MRGGHNAVPTAVKKLRGTAQPCRMNPREPQLEAVKVPAPPAGMVGDELQAWVDLAPQVDGLSVYTAADAVGFEALVGALVRYRRVARDPDSPTKEFCAASNVLAARLTGFGLTPASRAKVNSLAPRADEFDPDGEFAN